MGKKISQLVQLTAAQAAQTDLIPIVDISAGKTKYITLKDLTGLPDVGWIATGESWAYSSWTLATRIGVVTVPSDATTKYTPGMRIRFSQSTGGTKYGVITAVTATTLSIFFPSPGVLQNEAISSPVYSPEWAPVGFDPDVNDAPWQPYTPTWTNMTIGNAVVSCRYKKIGKTVFVRIQVALGSTSSSAANTVIQGTLPLPQNSDYGSLGIPVGNLKMNDTGNGNYPGVIRLPGSDKFDLICFTANATYVTEYGNPAALGNGDVIYGQFVYETT